MKWTVKIESTGHKYWSLKDNIDPLSWTVYDLAAIKKAEVKLVSDTDDPAVAVNKAITDDQWTEV